MPYYILCFIESRCCICRDCGIQAAELPQSLLNAAKALTSCPPY
ncbi:hypothetical protein HNQ56_001348 [Anaerotaenia torta]